jgi:methyl-accepting chemotaxis protein PixJ
LAAPIFVDNQPIGFIFGQMFDRSRMWEQTEIDQICQIANQMGMSLTQAELVKQLEVANEQQKRFAQEQKLAKESLQKNAWELLMQVYEISQGNLTIRARVTDDEIGTIADSYNATVENLQSLVLSVQQASLQLVHTTSESGVSVTDLSAEAIQQAEEIAIAHDRLQTLKESLEIVLDNAISAEVAVGEASEIVSTGESAMNRTVEGMVAIRNTVAETTKKVKRLGESSQKISKVVNLIGSFAAQTNLLALNASIEAARAGEEGRGFAVVAEEVRSLAKQSALATAEIEKLVAGIQSETSEVVTAMEMGTEQVAIGTKLVNETRSSLTQITDASGRISELVEAIAQSAMIQSANSLRLNETMEQVSDIANRTSSRADLVQASFHEVLNLAQTLQTNIDRFKVEESELN